MPNCFDLKFQLSILALEEVDSNKIENKNIYPNAFVHGELKSAIKILKKGYTGKLNM